jgi:hydrogenase expression/formation protein HypD
MAAAETCGAGPMKYLDEFRNSAAARRLIADIRRRATRCWTVMEVCGGQTHSLLRHGIDAELDGAVELIHGPGCPVCVTALEAIDFAQTLSMQPGVTLASFGDMLRVPGSRHSLLEARASGGNVRPVYSPLDAVEIARREPRSQVVFFAVGFETTAPATALAVHQAAKFRLENFSLLVAHVCVLPAMETIAAAPDCRVQGFLAAGHVCTITGCEHYAPFAERFQMPVVVTGFEPVDLLHGIGECVRQLEAGQPQVVNCYARTARRSGNGTARNLMSEVYEVCDRPWRGFGLIAGGGLKLRSKYRQFDAEHRFGQCQLPIVEPSECRSGDVLAGRIKPTGCGAFGTTCTPDHPLGAPMVSSEGACAAYYRYSAMAAANRQLSKLP